MNRRDFTKLAMFAAAVSQVPFVHAIARLNEARLKPGQFVIDRKRGPNGGTYTIQSSAGAITPPIPWDATEAQVQEIVDRTLNKPRIPPVYDVTIRVKLDS